MSASQTLDYDYPYSLAPDAVRETYASRVTMGFGAHHLLPGEGVRTHTFSSASACHNSPLFEGLRPSRGFYPPMRPMWPTSDTPVASPAPVFVGPISHAFAWVLPGESRQDRFCRCCVTSERLSRSGAPSIDRGRFASAELTLHLGANSHRAASRIFSYPHARRLNRRGPGYESAVGAPTHRSRIARCLFHP